jgi:phage terminase Nu1 subunit (DNA packaging protein)
VLHSVVSKNVSSNQLSVLPLLNEEQLHAVSHSNSTSNIATPVTAVITSILITVPLIVINNYTTIQNCNIDWVCE